MWAIKTLSPICMFLIKGSLTIAGGRSLFDHGIQVYKLEAVKSSSAPNWILLYILMNIFDELKAIALNRHSTDHVHHIVTGIGMSIDWLYGEIKHT